MRFSCLPSDQPIPSGSRAEHTMGAPGDMDDGMETWYATAFYLPSGDTFGRGDVAWPSGGSTWQIIWQLHHYGSSGSPPIALCADSAWGASGGERIWFDVRSSTGSGATTMATCELARPIPRGVWCKVLFRVKLSNAGAGELEGWFATGSDPLVQKFNRTGMTNFYTGSDSTGAFERFGVYRDTTAPRTDLYHAGWARGTEAQCRDWLSNALYAGGGSPPPTPTVTVTSPTSGQSFAGGTVPYNVTLTDAPIGYKLYVGFAPAGVSSGALTSLDAPHSGSLAVPVSPALNQTFYASLHDAGGTKVAEQTFPITMTGVATPPPPPVYGGGGGATPPPTPTRTPTSRRVTPCVRTKLWLRRAYRRFH